MLSREGRKAGKDGWSKREERREGVEQRMVREKGAVGSMEKRGDRRLEKKHRQVRGKENWMVREERLVGEGKKSIRVNVLPSRE